MRGFLVAILLGTVAMSAAQDPNIPKDLKTFWLMYYVKAEDGPTLSQEQSAE